MPRKLRQLRADLRKAGFSVDHQTGSHEVWKHPLLSGISANLAGSDGADAKSYQERQVADALAKLREAQQQEEDDS